MSHRCDETRQGDEMGLWIFMSDALDEEIQKASEIADQLFKKAGVDPEAAQQAAIDAADLSAEHDGATPNADLVILWFNAEFAAFEYLQDVTGEWPNGASLIYVQQGE